MQNKPQKERLSERLFLRITPTKKKQWQDAAANCQMSLRAWLQMKADKK